jgi:hypothetical protein
LRFKYFGGQKESAIYDNVPSSTVLSVKLKHPQNVAGLAPLRDTEGILANDFCPYLWIIR